MTQKCSCYLTEKKDLIGNRYTLTTTWHSFSLTELSLAPSSIFTMNLTFSAMATLKLYAILAVL